MKSISSLSLSELLAELDERGIRYLPSATRPELEQLLQKTQESLIVPSNSSLKDLIDQLDRRDIRYPPTATRKELEMLLFGSKSTAENTKPRQQSVDLPKSPISSNGDIPLSDYTG